MISKISVIVLALCLSVSFGANIRAKRQLLQSINKFVGSFLPTPIGTNIRETFLAPSKNSFESVNSVDQMLAQFGGRLSEVQENLNSLGNMVNMLQGMANLIPQLEGISNVDGFGGGFDSNAVIGSLNQRPIFEGIPTIDGISSIGNLPNLNFGFDVNYLASMANSMFEEMKEKMKDVIGDMTSLLPNMDITGGDINISPNQQEQAVLMTPQQKEIYQNLMEEMKKLQKKSEEMQLLMKDISKGFVFI